MRTGVLIVEPQTARPFLSRSFPRTIGSSCILDELEGIVGDSLVLFLAHACRRTIIKSELGRISALALGPLALTAFAALFGSSFARRIVWEVFEGCVRKSALASSSASAVATTELALHGGQLLSLTLKETLLFL